MCVKGKQFLLLSIALFLFSALLISYFYPFFSLPRCPTPIPMSSPVSLTKPPLLRFEDNLPQDSTLQAVLLKDGFTRAEIHRLVQDVRPVYDLNRVRAGHRFGIDRLADGTFQSLFYDISDEEYLLVRRRADDYIASRHSHNFDVVIEEIYGQISGSLYQTLVSQGEEGRLVAQLWDILVWDVDFTAVQPDDSFKLMVEKKYRNGNFVKYGKILAVEFRSRKKNVLGFLFEDSETGEAKYYDQQGRPVRKSLLRVPFRFDPRITSRFSYSRYHPILKTRRPHLGIDYGAPAGTPVLASGSGTVVFAGTKGGYGKLVQVRHPRRYLTSYAHLSRIYVRPGQKVKQGQRIGGVGSTGLATGPHLDYRVQHRGQYINPKVVSFPSDEPPISKQDWQEFVADRDTFRQRLDSIPETKPYLNRVYRGS